MFNKIKLDIGSGRPHFEDYITVDNDPSVGADIDWDIENGALPHSYEKNGEKIKLFCNCDEIRAYHILEHIKTENKVKVMRLFYDMLKPNGILNIEVPCYPFSASIQDPTHFSYWNIQSFWYFIKGNKFGEGFAKRYSQYEVPLFEFVKDNKEGIVGKDILKDYFAYNITLKKPNELN